MDPLSIVQKLEEAAKALLAPPNLVTPEQRQDAERIFIEFRKFPFPYDTCRFILEHSKDDYTKFQAAATIKCSIVREWATLQPHDVEQLRIFLLQYVTSHLGLQAYVREEIFQTLAVIVKRGMMESDAIAKDKLFDEVMQLISTGDLSMQLIACSLLTALLSEFSSYSKSAGTGFTWEFHIRCKRHFESNYLLRTMVFTLQLLEELVKCEPPFSRDQLPVMMRFLSIASDILSWEFLPLLTRRHMVPFGGINQPPLRPPASWRQTICRPELINLFFTLYGKVHYNAELSHHALQCLGQLATLNGAVFNDSSLQLTYLTQFITAYLGTLKSLELKSYDSIGISTIYENLLRWFKIQLFAELPGSIFEPFLVSMTSLTCTYITAAKACDSSEADDNVFMEALEKLLVSWTTLLLEEEDHFGKGQFKKQATEIFNTYVQFHITNLSTGLDALPVIDETEYEEEDRPDKERFSEQLASLGIVGREVPEHSLATLARLIDERSEWLKVHLEKHSQQVKSGVTDDTGQAQLNMIFEDLHWLLLIATSVLTDDAQGETAMIPTKILHYSVSQSKVIDSQQTLSLITKPELCSVKASQTNGVDHVIRLLSSVLRLFYIESIAVQNSLGSILSPQLDSTSSYFLGRFIDTYLTPLEQNYSEMSPTLETILGADTEGAVHLINVIIDKVQLTLSLWNSEVEVLEETLHTLLTLVRRSHRCKTVIKCQHFWTFMSSVSENSFPLNTIPATSKRQLYRAIVYCGGCMDKDRQQFWERMVQKPMEQMVMLTTDGQFRKRKDEPRLKEALIDSLEILIGCCQATRLVNQSALFDIVEPSLQATTVLLDVYHNDQQMVELSLEVFCEVVSSMICCLDSSSSERLYEQCLAAIHVYTQHINVVHGARKGNEDAEEDKFKDVSLILKLLLNLMSKDLVDFGLSETGEEMSVTATEVVLLGLTVIVPIMDAALLQFPSLCSLYYKLLAFVSELRPDKVLELPPSLLEPILSSIHLSFTRFGSDVAKSGFEFLSEMAMHVANKKDANLAIRARLDGFLQPILNLLLFEVFDVDLCDIITGCLYYLIALYPDQYKRLEEMLLEQQKGKPHHQLLVDSFKKLEPSLTGSTRQAKLQFIDSMNALLLDVKGFLCVL
ncbi:exportin-4-like [Watersipora subatra]|uniref:exportin-4-like n=1 Tax=Watersipora subatra TaxID=2589382 RepID=UPI00355C50A0